MKSKKLTVVIITLVLVASAAAWGISSHSFKNQSASVLLGEDKLVTARAGVDTVTPVKTMTIVDVCPNFDGNQTVLPAGYQVVNGKCVCQDGYVGISSTVTPIAIPACVLNPRPKPTVTTVVTDLCLNVPGVQSGWFVPGYQVGPNGQCTPIQTITVTATIIPDVCSNIDGVQETLPVGYQVTGGQCTVSSLSSGFYLMAGHDNSQMYNDFWKMNTTTAAWTNITQNAPWTRREYPESVYFNGKIYLMGGIDASGYLNDVWTYDGVNWTRVTQHASWSPRARFAAVVWNNEIWVMGGRESSTGSRHDVWKSSDGVTWTQVNPIGPIWEERNGFKAVAYDNKLWVVSGVGNIAAHQWYGDVWNTSDGIHWNKVTNDIGWGRRTLFGLSVYQNKLWVLGGFYHDGTASHVVNDGWNSPNGTTWAQVFSNIWPVAVTTTNAVPYQHTPLNTFGRRELTTAVFNNKIWAMGGSFITIVGEGDEHFYNDVWTYNGTSWNKVDADPSTPGTIDNAPWAARDGLTSVLVP